MKKIKNIKQLRREKKALRQREKELLRRVSLRWQQVKEGFRPQNIFWEQVRSFRQRNSAHAQEESILKSILSFGAGLLIRKLIKRTEDRFERFFN